MGIMGKSTGKLFKPGKLPNYGRGKISKGFGSITGGGGKIPGKNIGSIKRPGKLGGKNIGWMTKTTKLRKPGVGMRKPKGVIRMPKMRRPRI